MNLRDSKNIGVKLIKYLGVLLLFLSAFWATIALTNIQFEILKERELKDVSTHAYLENYNPKFTNITVNYRNDLSTTLLGINLAELNSDLILNSVTRRTKQLSSFLNLNKNRLEVDIPSQSFKEYAEKKLIKSELKQAEESSIFKVPDLRVIKARNPFSLKEGALGQLSISKFANNKIDTVDVLYFLIDSKRLKREGAQDSLFSRLWIESDYMDSFNLNDQQDSYDVLIPELSLNDQKSLVILSSNRPIIQGLLEKTQNSKLSQWLKASVFDAYMPTDNFEILIEIIPLEVSEANPPIELESIPSQVDTEDDFFDQMELKHWINQNKREDYELSFVDRSIKYTNKAGFDFMSFTKQYCQEDDQFDRFDACEFLKRFSNNHKLNYNNEKTAELANNSYLNSLSERLKVFEYNGKKPITLQRNDVYGLSLKAGEKRNFINFMSNKRIFDIQTDLDMFLSGLVVDGPILRQNLTQIFNNTALLGYNLDSRNLDSESLFKANGPIANLTNFNSLSDWTLLGNQDTKSGTMILLAWDDLINPWMSQQSKKLSSKQNKFAYSLNVKNEDPIYYTNETLNLKFDLLEAAGIGIRDEFLLDFNWTYPDLGAFSQQIKVLPNSKTISLPEINFSQEGVYSLRVQNKFGEELLNYKFILKDKRELKYRVYLIPFTLSDNYKESAPDDPTPYYPWDNYQPGYPDSSPTSDDQITDDTIPSPEDIPEKECKNQAEINSVFDNLNTFSWENYYVYEDNYQDLLNQYASDFSENGCNTPIKKERPTRIIYTGGGGSNGGGGGGPVVPPPGDTVINHVFPMQCYIGRRTYNTEILQLENNTASDQTITFRVEGDNLGNPAIEDNFTAGNADFWVFTSSVDSTGGAIFELPNPRDYGILTQWQNVALQIEVVAGVIQIANANMGPFPLPAGEKRQIATVFDCGVDMLLGETGVIRVTVETNG